MSRVKQSSWRCKIQDFPCRYLGVPLSFFKLKKCDEQPLIDAVERKSTQHSRQDCTGQEYLICNSYAHVHCPLPVYLGNRKHRQASPRFHLVRNGFCLRGALQGRLADLLQTVSLGGAWGHRSSPDWIGAEATLAMVASGRSGTAMG